MIMKKIIAWITIAALFVCVLSACGKKRFDETKPAGTSENESTTTATEGSSGSDTEKDMNNGTDTGTDTGTDIGTDTGADTDSDNGGTTEADVDESETELGTHYDENQGEWDPD